MINLPPSFVGRITRLLGSEAGDFLASYNLPDQKAVRVNTLKMSPQKFVASAPLKGLAPVPWEPNGFYVENEKPGKTVLHAAGAYYVQEPSAMCAAPLLNVRPGERVLDLCSAPGGKGTQLAQAMGGEGIIYLNEINFSRAKILSSNVERMGIKNAVVTCAPPARLAEEFVGYFNKILVDAPCSGEGMFKKEPEALSEWSEQNVAMCAQRQAGILACAAQMLAPGGLLVYSTCTFSNEENSGQIAAFLSSNPSFSLISERKLFPHKVRGEGHYAALLQKNGGQQGEVKLLSPRVGRSELALYRQFERDYLKISFGNIHAVENRLFSLPQGCADISVQTLRAGVALGECIKQRFEPAHALAMCLKEGEATFIELDERTALSYLSGNTFNCPAAPSGWAVAAYSGLPLGWVKVVGGVAKNHLPKGLRINT